MSKLYILEVTELKGEKVMTLDYKPSLPSMMVVDDLLIVANGRSNDKVMIYDKETLALKSKITLAERPD